MTGDMLRVGACSFAALPGNTEKNLAGIKVWCSKARDEHVDLLLFPELSLSGYWLSTELHYEAQPRDGPAVRDLVAYLSDIDTGMHVSVGLAESHGGTIYNCQVIVNREGIVSAYRKTHWPNAEMGTWGCGDRYLSCKVGDFTVGTAICYDNNFPEVHRIYGLLGTEVLLSPYAYGSRFDPGKPETVRKAIFSWKDKEKYYLRCAAHANHYWVVACVGGGHVKDYIAKGNPGKGMEYYFPGVIMFIDPGGNMVKESPDDAIEERLLWCDVSRISAIEARRSTLNHFKDRRTGTYGRLTELP